MPDDGRILRVRVSQEDIRKTYAALSPFYGVLEDRFERQPRQRLLEMLELRQGERVLEIGVGAGCGVESIARAVGESGEVCGVDITPEMLSQARRRIGRAGFSGRVELKQGDARELSCGQGTFDAVYMLSTLELFDTPDIPKVLREVKRVLTLDGRLGLGSFSREGHEQSVLLRAYEWLHHRAPRYASCRPIYVERSLREAGFRLLKSDDLLLGGIFPMKLVVARPQEEDGSVGGEN